MCVFNLGFLWIQRSFYVALPLKLFNIAPTPNVGLCSKRSWSNGSQSWRHIRIFWEVLKIQMFKIHPKLFKSLFRYLGSSHRYFLNLSGDSNVKPRLKSSIFTIYRMTGERITWLYNHVLYTHMHIVVWVSC